ncbi:MAG: DsrE family protein [Terriglobales bacterium]
MTFALIVFGTVLTAGFMAARQHRVVIEVNIPGTEEWQAVLHNVVNLQQAFGIKSTSIEVVALGPGIGMVAKTDGELQAQMQRLADSGVHFVACSNTMRALKMQPDDLLPFVKPVDSGAAEIVRKQEAGWAYLKGGK